MIQVLDALSRCTGAGRVRFASGVLVAGFTEL